MSDVLAKICADKRREVARRQAATPLGDVQKAAARTDTPRGFAAALARSAAAGRTALIAEIKKASPSRGLIRADFDPVVLAQAYADAGATCLSVLTDGPYFQGHEDHLRAARGAVRLPVIRKDFMLEPYQIWEARAIGADCVLLILAAIDDATAASLAALARELEMDVLAEVHDADELRRALPLDAMIGINNRNLKTLQVDLATFEQLAPKVPRERLLVAESGIKTPADIARLKASGACAFLVGESLMAQSDLRAATRALLAPVLVA